MYRRVIADRFPAMRRVRLHARIGNAIEHAFGSRAAMVASELAMHFEEAQDFERALHHYTVAADTARNRLAHREAVALLTKALGYLAKCPETPARVRQAIALHVSLGASLLVTDGYSAVGFKHAFERARGLCKALDDDQCLFPVLVGLMRFEILQPDFQQASCLGEELLTLAERVNDATLLHGAYMMLGGSSIFQGQFTQAHDYSERSLSLYDHRHSAWTVQHGDNPEVLGACWIALALWYRGYPDQAVTRMDEAVRIAEAAGEPLSLTFILFWSAFLHRWRGEVDAVRARLDRLIPLTEEHGIPHNVALGTGLRGWVLVQEGRVEPGIALIREGLAHLAAIGHGLGRPFFLALLAEALGDTGDITGGLAALQEAHELAMRTGERMHLAEIYRLRGELTALLGASGENADTEVHSRAEECCRRAIETARAQRSRSLELRAAISLAQLWRLQGRTSDARRLLGEIECWLTDGLETDDRQGARQLLRELEAVGGRR
jgi:adenylate cyclase